MRVLLQQRKEIEARHRARVEEGGKTALRQLQVDFVFPKAGFAHRRGADIGIDLQLVGNEHDTERDFSSPAVFDDGIQVREVKPGQAEVFAEGTGNGKGVGGWREATYDWTILVPPPAEAAE